MSWSDNHSRSMLVARQRERRALTRPVFVIALWMAAVARRAFPASAMEGFKRQAISPPRPTSHLGREPRMWCEEGLHTLSRFAASPTAKVNAPDDFTARVMARLDMPTAQPPRPATAKPAKREPALMLDRLTIAFGVFALSTLVVLLTSLVIAFLAPEIAFAFLSLLVSGFILLLVSLRTMLGALSSVGSNSMLLVLLAAGLVASLLFWSRLIRPALRLTRNA